MFKDEGVELTIAPRVFDEIASLAAVEYKVGTRSLRGIVEEMVTPILYVIPDRCGILKVATTSPLEDTKLMTE